MEDFEIEDGELKDYIGEDTDIIIPYGVTSIGSYAFSDCSSLTSIVIPDSVTSIGDSAFEECSSLTSIVIPDGITSIENRSFSGCISLRRVVIPDSVTSIGDFAFDECSSLKRVIIPDSVTSIGDYAFSDCSSLRRVAIPNSVSSIGKYAFDDCAFDYDDDDDDYDDYDSDNYDYDDDDDSEVEIFFDFPKGYYYIEENDGEDKSIVAGETDDEDAFIKYECKVLIQRYDPYAGNTLEKSYYTVEKAAEEIKHNKELIFEGKHKTYIMDQHVTIDSDYGEKNMWVLWALIQVTDDFILVLVHYLDIEQDDDEILGSFEFFINAVKSIRFEDGGKLTFANTLNPTKLMNELKDIDYTCDLEVSENGFVVDPNMTIEEMFEDIKSTIDELRDDEFDNKFNSITPDIKLYPYYNMNDISNDTINSFFGGYSNINVVNSTSGTEMKFAKLSEKYSPYNDDCEEDNYEAKKKAVNRINNLNYGYELAGVAKMMRKLFRVDKKIFNYCNDRENELYYGHMKSAYMFSAIRSFAWTLADYCKENETTPADIDVSIANEIADYVFSRNCLNFNNKTYCKGLCSSSDMNVYFLPDALSIKDKEIFLSSNEEYDDYPPEVHSLESLREDLSYIYPAIKTMYFDLYMHRDNSEKLEGNESDIVYAWIDLALAADEPFVIESGVMNYVFDWRGQYDD